LTVRTAISAGGAAKVLNRARAMLRSWRLGALVPSIAIVAVVMLPICVIAAIALSGTADDWPHLATYVLPQAFGVTLTLVALVAMGTALVGVSCAWIVVTYDFPFRRLLTWALILPLAVPPYLAAYAFGEFFTFTGPVQSGLRSLFGFQTPRDYWFPDIRSTGGAALVMVSVLYPYVYLTTRAVFILQGRNMFEVARTLGGSPLRVLMRVQLPVARPAIAAGVALVLMETLNDIGASTYLGVRTLTTSVYTTWLNRGSLEGAAQIAMLMLVAVFALVMTEQWARRNQRYHPARGTQIRARPARVRLTGWRAGLAILFVLVPFVSGFGVPVYVFADYASRRMQQLYEPALMNALANSLLTAFWASVLAIVAALVLLNAARVARSRPATILARLPVVGYAIPGTILSLGLLFALAAIDNWIDGQARQYFGYSTGLLLTGSATAVVLACAIRFLALAEGSIRSGLDKLPPNLDEAARTLGRTPLRAGVSILLPLLTPAILAAMILVFVDTVKELSATMLLRPFGFNTLATFVYENASRGAVEDGAIASLLIIATALIPVALLSSALMRDREASF